MLKKSCKNIVITLGDPLGIGPEITFKALASLKTLQNNFVIIGPVDLFKRQKSFLTIKNKKNITFINTSQNQTTKNTIKNLTQKQAGHYALLSLQKAVKLIKEKQANALVTAPASKENITKAGFHFTGHTEYLCNEFNTKDFAMMLFNHKLKVVLLTTHEPLCKIPSLITHNNIITKLNLTLNTLKKDFNIKKPRIAVCGLNPHAGENGLIGSEETKTIKPAISKFIERTKNKVVGPLPADTIFLGATKGLYDAVLCLYHDQGLIPLKLTGMQKAINITLGLPFIRTSPAHGTAFDIARKNMADHNSMLQAIKAAVDFTH